MKRFILAFATGALLVAIGCHEDAKVASTSPLTVTGPVTTTGDSTPADQATPSPAVPLSQLPASLQNDGFHYYGLSRTQPATYLVSKGDASTSSPGDIGTETIRFQGMDKGKAKFDIERTGALEPLGSEHVVLDDSGVTVNSVDPGNLVGHPLDMPAKLTPGATWKTDYTVKLDTSDSLPGGGTSEDHSTFKVIRTEKVTTKAGTFDAILIESNGNDTLNGKSFNLKTQSWYVKDRGVVKFVVTTLQGKATSTLTIEAAPGDTK